VAAVSIVDYGIGNTGSIVNMLKKLRVDAALVSTPAQMAAAERLVLPGIGAFDACMGALRRSGLDEGVLEFAVRGRPLLGICVGMQMLTVGSEEGELPGLGLIQAHTKRFAVQPGLRIPHMGWDRVEWTAPRHSLARNMPSDSRFYFVHSYRVTCQAATDCVALCTYGEEFAAAIGNGSICGVQFHPEKSHRFGLALLNNFSTT
jgi:glutamine amidotransferase